MLVVWNFLRKLVDFEQKDSQCCENSYRLLWTIPIPEIGVSSSPFTKTETLALIYYQNGVRLQGECTIAYCMGSALLILGRWGLGNGVVLSYNTDRMISQLSSLFIVLHVYGFFFKSRIGSVNVPFMSCITLHFQFSFTYQQSQISNWMYYAILLEKNSFTYQDYSKLVCKSNILTACKY